MFRLAQPAERDAVASVLAASGLHADDVLVSGTCYLVAERAGQVVGTVGLEFGPMGACLIRSLAVLPEARGQGVGTQLVGEAMEEARRRLCDRLYLLAHEAPPSSQQLGFREVPVPELVAALPACPQVRQTARTDGLPALGAWRLDL